MLEEVRGYLVGIDEDNHYVEISDIDIDFADDTKWYKVADSDYWNLARDLQGEEVIMLLDDGVVVALKCSAGMTDEDVLEFKKEVYEKLDREFSLSESIVPTEKLTSEISEAEVEAQKAEEAEKEAPRKRSRFVSSAPAAKPSHLDRDRTTDVKDQPRSFPQPSTKKQYEVIDTTLEEKELRRYCVEQAVTVVAAAVGSTPTDILKMTREDRLNIGKSISTIAREIERYINQKYTLVTKN